MRERDIERKFVIETKKKGGMALKLISPGMNGVPDRLVLLPGGRMSFVEVKAPGGKMRSLQIKLKQLLEDLGFRVYCIDGKEQIEGVLDEIEKG